jgi:hypothetical protein
VSEPRRYQLQSEPANRLILELLEAAGVPPERRQFFQQLLTTVLKLHEDGAVTPNLKITNAALKELRYGYKVFAPYRDIRKVTVFGSARAPGDQPMCLAARELVFSKTSQADSSTTAAASRRPWGHWRATSDSAPEKPKP